MSQLAAELVKGLPGVTHRKASERQREAYRVMDPESKRLKVEVLVNAKGLKVAGTERLQDAEKKLVGAVEPKGKEFAWAVSLKLDENEERVKHVKSLLASKLGTAVKAPPAPAARRRTRSSGK